MTPRILSETAPPADHRVPYGDAPSQFVDFRFPAGRGVHPLAIMIHGGFWRAKQDLLHAGHLCAALAHAGFASANVEYRRAGQAGGGWPGTFEDVRHAVHFARLRAAEYRGDARRTVVIGHSAGGHLALWLASEIEDLAGIAGLAPVACLRLASELGLGNHAVRDFMQASPAEAPECFQAGDPANRAARVPRVLLHGTSDDTVPLCVSQEYVRLREGDAGSVRLVQLDGAGHMDLVDPQSPVWPIVLREVQSLAG